MELTFDKTLEKAIALHGSGELQNAELLYRTLLEIRPDQPDANHKLGTLALENGNIEEALERFINAIQANPNAENYWLSYIEGLIKAGRFFDAGQVLADVKRAGVRSLKLDQLKAKMIIAQKQTVAPSRPIAPSSDCVGNKPKFSLEESTEIEEEGPSYRQMAEVVEAFNAGRFSETEALARRLTEAFPDHAVAWKALGAALQQTGNPEESRAAMDKSVQLAPLDAEAHYNLGCVQLELLKPREAMLCFRKATEIVPDYAEAHCNLAAALNELSRFTEAEQVGRRAIFLGCDIAEVHCNLGNAVFGQNKYEESEASYRQALTVRFEYAEAHHNLGKALKALGRLEEAEESYSRAIELKPEYKAALINRSRVRFDRGQFSAALEDADACDTKKSRVQALESLFAMGRFDEIYERIEHLADSDPYNIGLAAFSAFISEKLKKPTANDFCPRPLSLVHASSLASHIRDSDVFVLDLIEELQGLETIWEPSGKSTHNGFQLTGDAHLFEQPSANLKKLEDIIHRELDRYLLHFGEEKCALIQQWPAQKILEGWHVILKSQGYQDSHLHSGGWVSGVIYLKVVPALDNHEGAIEFSLNGKNYSDLNSPGYVYQPSSGDIVLFPSSLHHRTIPFSADSDRISIAFDLLPPTSESRQEREVETPAPSPSSLSHVVKLYQDGRFGEAEAAARSLTEKFSKHQFGWKVLGAVLQETANFPAALVASETSLHLSPHDPEAHNNLGNVLKSTGKLASAEASYRQAIAVSPDYAQAHYNLGILLKDLNQLGEAKESLQQAVALDPDHAHAKHVLAAIVGETTCAAPIEYVEKLFDAYADKFDSSLVDGLGYQIPTRIAEILCQTNGDAPLGSVLDLGCGTGLLGMAVAGKCKRLEGLDISRNMLRRAETREVYDKLVQQDIVSYLSSQILNFDYFVATDVFVYLGDLSEVFKLIKERNCLGCKLAFTVEHQANKGFALQQSGRYAHSRAYIEELCRKYSCELTHFEVQNLRMEKSRQLTGGLYLISFPSEPNPEEKSRVDLKTQAHIDKVMKYIHSGETAIAEGLSRAYVQQYPTEPGGWSMLGISLRSAGKVSESLVALQKAADARPTDADAHNNLGATYRELGQLATAEASYRLAVQIRPDFAEAYVNLGNTLRELGDRSGASANYMRAIELQPDCSNAHFGLGVLSYDAHEYRDAAEKFELVDTEGADNYLLKCSYALDDEHTFSEQLDAFARKHPPNAVVGSLSSCAQLRYGNVRSNPFCNEPLCYVREIDLSAQADFEAIFSDPIERILSEERWTERSQGLLRNGTQTAGDIFSHREVMRSDIEAVLRQEIDKYRTHFAGSKEGFIQNWPSAYRLRGWLVSMQSGGALAAHMHEGGWISGSVYINVPPKSKPHSGNLVLCAGDQENDFSAKSIHERIVEVKTGGLCLFPSSLRHYTVPFVSSEARVVLAFDVVQV